MANPAKRKFCRKPARHHPAADSHAPALHRTGAYPDAGVRRVPRKKVISPYWEQSIAKKCQMTLKDLEKDKAAGIVYCSSSCGVYFITAITISASGELSPAKSFQLLRIDFITFCVSFADEEITFNRRSMLCSCGKPHGRGDP